MTIIRGAATHVVAQALTLGALVNGTTVTRGVFRARTPRGAFVNWEAVIESPTTTSLTLSYQLVAQLERGLWQVEAFLYTGGSPGTLVTSIYFDTLQITVQPSAVPAP